MNISAFYFVGIAVRTTNANQQSAKDIGALWQRFFAEGVMSKIPNKVDDKVLSIYTDYESDDKGAYTTCIGVKVSSLDMIPEGMIGRTFPNEHFKKYEAKGAMPNAVVQVWNEIWAKGAQLNRKFTYDMEVYGEKCQQHETPEVDIYVAVNG